MKYIKKFEGFTQFSMYSVDWKKHIPYKLTIIKDKIRNFHKENVMLNEDQIQIVYTADEILFGDPDEFQIDIYMINNGHFKIDIDLTYGDLVVSEFSIESPNKVSVIQYTSYHSKFDPSNTVFALSDESISDFVKFINKFDDIKISEDDLKFLDKRDNYVP